ncbi:hypothetical protein DFA_06262 [Cavenderia fasciculata]|uniref:Uncharacterized protein n=1 Tax=Cavenderia fasciculata TaxID=261658 RepID=F4PKJ8_CACFS|nr:uncharacterized protein DFA_06262 [Cavenderia fasciculata]EGG24122.1 hypothetical protein DFA_06262 [Cavenderia fasciculata]|eukprot:XP_004361973.1 hypothetical protein DFA_06262 [Cavenderia fasciculata]
MAIVKTYSLTYFLYIESPNTEEISEPNSLINWYLYSPSSSTYVKANKYKKSIAHPRAALHWTKGGMVLSLWYVDVRQVA